MKIQALAVAFSFLSIAALQAADATPKTGLVLPGAKTLHKAQVETPPSFEAGADRLPARFSLRGKMPPAGNQGSLNSCVGWSVGYGLLSYLHRDSEPAPRNPLYVYHWARVNQTPRRNAPIEDKGSTFEDGFQAIIHNGACEFGKYTDFRLEPPRSISAEAQDYRAKIAHPPFELVVSNLSSIKKTLTEGGGKPLPAGFRLCQEFHEQTDFEPRILTGNPHREVKVWTQAGKPMRNNAGQAMEVLHAMLIIGYDDEIQAFEVLNSHGREWGDDGYFWVDYDFFKSKDANGKPLCCELVYSYTPVRSGVLGFFDKIKNAARRMFGAPAENVETEGYCRIATLDAGRVRIRPDDLNFEMEPDAEALERIVQKGAVLTLRNGVNKLVLRADLLIDPANGNTTLGEKVGELRRGDRFEITDLKKATLHHGKRIEYWARGFRLN